MALELFTHPLIVDLDPEAGNPTPVRCTVDFGRIMGVGEDGPLVDPYTVTVTRLAGGDRSASPVQFDENLLYSNVGWIAWLVEDPERGGEWWVEFRPRGLHGEMVRPRPRPMVGVGEEVRYGDGEPHPIGVPGMDQFPIAADWDGDGVIDIISSSHYSNAPGMPWSGIFVWRNIGSNEAPLFGPPMRLYAQGADQVDESQYRLHPHGPPERPRSKPFISEYYLRCDVFDWFGSGRLDLITASKQTGIRVYRNCGELDPAGMPTLELELTIEIPSGLPPTPYISPRVVDWDHSGRPSILIGAPYILSGIDNGQIVLLRNISSSPHRPKFRRVLLGRSSFWSPPGNTEDWRQINTFGGFRAFSFDYTDIDSDGKEELLVCHGRHIPQPVIEVWRNCGTADEPCMVQDGQLPWSSHYMHFGFRFVSDPAFDGCLLAGRNGASGIRYFRRRAADAREPGSYEDRGLLMGQDVPLRVEGWSRPAVVEANGSVVMVSGDEPGFLSAIEVESGADRTVLGPPRKIRDQDRNVLQLHRESILHDNDLDRYLGLTKPVLCDWDGDGQLDLILGHNTNRVLWLRAYKPAEHAFGDMRELKVKADPNPFAWRAGPAVADLDGDGRLELITSDSRKQICMFRQGAGPEGHQLLEPPIPLMYRSGEPLSAITIPPAIYDYGMVCIHACDWNQSGTIDLLVSSNYTTCLLENVGTDREPVFAEPRILRTPDGIIEIGHHETAACTWDWDRDGRPDLIIGGESGAFYLFHRDFLVST